MNLQSRKILDHSFTAFSGLSIAFMALALVILLGPIIAKGVGAYVFKGTVEHRRMQLELLERGNPEDMARESAQVAQARKPLYDAMKSFRAELKGMMNSDPQRAFKLEEDFIEFGRLAQKLLGPAPGARVSPMPRDKFGQNRWDQSLHVLFEMNNVEEWDYSGEGKGVKVHSPRSKLYKGTALEPVFASYLTEDYARKMLLPEWTFYYGFFTDTSFDAHLFGGIWAEVLGTVYLTFGAMLLAIPAGILAAVYLVEYAGDTHLIGFIRSCISTLAGVPSIVFGLFGLACFISADSWFQISRTPSVAAGCATLALLILPTIIRSSEEAIRAIPISYREASMGLGATKWKTISSVILPAALPGILTGIVISMGRAAGETAPIIFTAAVSVGRPLGLHQIMSQPTPALPWNIYNLCTEHEAVDEIRHVQFGMVFTLIAIVLVLNISAIYLRARISKRLRG